MIRWFLRLIKPLSDRVSARITLHQQRYNIIEAQYNDRLYREIVDELMYLDLANQKLHNVVTSLVRDCRCIESDRKQLLVQELAEPIPVGVGTMRSENSDAMQQEVGVSHVGDN